ncbi:hypothetical protein [Roseibium sp. Sym1]|uniref:hypothetical protein n=1 Tax=Roseibium sp. Sym1 TaxID=3016006 RepID=UPI0022B5212B|nr:hypothetical protein [Roseibium sp. Sym1]
MTTFQEFQKICRRKQREYIASEKTRMAAAQELYWQYRQAMNELGLHDLRLDEITDRIHELDRMEKQVDDQFGDNPTMRWSFSRFLKRSDQPAPHQRKAIL